MVRFLYDGGYAKADASAVWLSRSGEVLITEAEGGVCDECDWPAGVESDDFWSAPLMEGL